MEYYKIILNNKKTNKWQYAIVKTDSHFEAEDKGKEYAKNWKALGYEFYDALWLNGEQIDHGEVVLIS